MLGASTSTNTRASTSTRGGRAARRVADCRLTLPRDCGQIFVVNAGPVGMALYSVLKVLLSSATAAKIQISEDCNTDALVQEARLPQNHANVAAAAPPIIRFPDRHFPGFPGYALYPSVQVAIAWQLAPDTSARVRLD